VAASTVAAFTMLPRHVLGGPQFVPPSELVNIAIIKESWRKGWEIA
jgi:hypothetical protein